MKKGLVAIILIFSVIIGLAYKQPVSARRRRDQNGYYYESDRGRRAGLGFLGGALGGAAIGGIAGGGKGAGYGALAGGVLGAITGAATGRRRYYADDEYYDDDNDEVDEDEEFENETDEDTQQRPSVLNRGKSSNTQNYVK